LGASPGASTAVTIMLEVLQRCFSDQLGQSGLAGTLAGSAAQH
jgi:L-2-hydroxyglutarate oxidase LhgO